MIGHIVMGFERVANNISACDMLRLTEVGGRYLIAGIFIYSGVPKLFDVSGFAAVVGAYGILPESLHLPVALLLPVFEMILAIGMMKGNRLCCIGGLALLLLFIAVLSYGVAAGLDIDCGCFGPEDPEQRAFNGLRVALGRDLLMLLPLLYSLWYQSYRKS